MQDSFYKMKSLRLFIQLSRPIYVLSAVLLYILGIGIAHYLSGQVNWTSFFLGLAWIVFSLLGTQYLNEYFDPTIMHEDPTWKHTPFSGGSGAIGVGRLPRQVALWAGLTCLTITASLTVLLIQKLGISIVGILILGLIFLGEFLYAIPPFRLVSSGYGELVMSIIVIGMFPALAFLLQGHDFHRLLIMVAFPLTTLHIAMLLALEFPDYASDLKQGKRPAIVRIGWQRGMIIHNILILVSFVILGAAFVFGLPLSVGWPVIFVLPIGLFQIWMMNRIADGAKPNWNLLVLVSISTFGLTTYLLTFAFWTH
jgi:1,4-dihydroxy-2-naphthoate octaprenyltransferase